MTKVQPGTLRVSYAMRSCVLYDDWRRSNVLNIVQDGALVLILADPPINDAQKYQLVLVLCDGIVGWLYVDSTLSV